MTQRKYTDREGVQRMAVDVIASQVEMLDSKAAAEPSTETDVDPFLPDLPE